MTWKTVMMVHDSPSVELRDFLQEAWTGDLTVFEVPAGKGNGSQKCSHHIKEELKELKGLSKDHKVLVLYGHGSWHHYTYGLCEHLAKPYKPYLYCQVDYHTDDGTTHRWGRKQFGRKPKSAPLTARELSCASFVNELKTLGATERIFIGCDSKCGPAHVKVIEQQWMVDQRVLGILKPQLEKKITAKRPKRTYVSIDLDVIRREDIVTGYGQGKITLEDLIEVYNAIRDTKEIISADILGYSGTGDYTYRDRMKKKKWHYYRHISKLVYAILACHITGRDYHELMKLRHWILKRHSHGQNSVDLDDLFKDIRI